MRRASHLAGGRPSLRLRQGSVLPPATAESSLRRFLWAPLRQGFRRRIQVSSLFRHHRFHTRPSVKAGQVHAGCRRCWPRQQSRQCWTKLANCPAMSTNLGVLAKSGQTALPGFCGCTKNKGRPTTDTPKAVKTSAIGSATNVGAGKIRSRKNGDSPWPARKSISRSFASKRAPKARTWRVFPGADFGRGADFAVTDAIRRVVPGTAKTAPKQRSAQGNRNTVQVRALSALFRAKFLPIELRAGQGRRNHRHPILSSPVHAQPVGISGEFADAGQKVPHKLGEDAESSLARPINRTLDNARRAQRIFSARQRSRCRGVACNKVKRCACARRGAHPTLWQREAVIVDDRRLARSHEGGNDAAKFVQSPSRARIRTRLGLVVIAQSDTLSAARHLKSPS